MSTTTPTLWSRAVRATAARGLLPIDHSALTPAELSAAAAQRGERRLVKLVDAWYYPSSYGGVRGAMSDEEAARLVAALESEIVPAEIVPPAAAPKPSPRRLTRCDLCGFPLPPPPP
jgi:hypothetical protein